MAKDKTQTLIGRHIEGVLTSLNDQYSFFLFLEHQFFEALRELRSMPGDRFTTEAFPENKHASKIHVRLRDLPSFRDGNRAASFGAYFMTSYEIAASFTHEAVALLWAANSTSFVHTPRWRDGPEQYYIRVLRASGYRLPDDQLIETLSYMRYRRN